MAALVVASALLSTAGQVVAPSSTQAEARAPEARPNVVFIMVDDMRADDLRFMPATQRLIGDQGVTFANALSPHPICCPARASVLTGRYTHNHGVYSVGEPYAFPSLPDRSTIATWLQRSGYATVYLGKYLNGYGRLPIPGSTARNSLRYVPPGWTDWRASIDGGLPKRHWANGTTYRYFDTTLSINGERFENYEGRYQSEVYGDLSAQIVRERARSADPFFFYASYTAPHNGGPIEPDDPGSIVGTDGTTNKFGTPARPDYVKGIFDAEVLAAPGAGWDKRLATDKPAYLDTISVPNEVEQAAMTTLTRQRAESLRVVDLQVRRTIRALDRSGELDNTLVIFTSDNGFFLGEQGIRQGKLLPHEPSLRVPLLMRGPGIPPGETRYDPFLSIDFPSTIAAAARIGPGHEVDGVNLLGVARRGDRGWVRPVLTATGPGDTVRETDQAGEPLDTTDPGPRELRWALGIRTDRYLYVDLATGEEELYDLSIDRDQYRNLANRPSHADVRDLLRQELRKVRACAGSACSAPLPDELATPPGQSVAR